MTPHEAVENFTEKAEKYGLSFLEKSKESVEVESQDENGFAVGLFVVADDLLQVTGGDWHEGFEDFCEALDCCAFLLSASCRLKTVYRGSTVSFCSVQSQSDGVWLDEFSVGFFLVPFWKSKRIVIQQNTVTKMPG